MRRVRRLLQRALWCALAAGCDPSGVTCSGDPFCLRDGVQGACVPSPASPDRFCAFPDVSCGAGLRWDATAGDGLGGACVAALDGGAPDLAARDAAGSAPDLAADLAPPPDLAHLLAWGPETSGTTVTLQGVWGRSADNLFIVGDSGTILHSIDDGKTWSPQASGTAAGLKGVHGTPATSDVFAVGAAGTLLHSADGMTWSAQASGTGKNLNAVCAGGGEQWVFGDGGLALHSLNLGATWTPVGTGVGASLLGCRIVQPNDVFAVGTNGHLLHWDGAMWTTLTSGTSANLHRVWASSANNVFVTSDAGILHSTNDGVTWSAPLAIGGMVVGLDGATPNDLDAVGFFGFIGRTQNGGGQWTAEASGTTNSLANVLALAPDDRFAVGTAGTILHYH
jgi:photosystem II stability/assembly factor-like uncharacterized protein